MVQQSCEAGKGRPPPTWLSRALRTRLRPCTIQRPTITPPRHLSTILSTSPPHLPAPTISSANHDECNPAPTSTPPHLPPTFHPPSTPPHPALHPTSRARPVASVGGAQEAGPGRCGGGGARRRRRERARGRRGRRHAAAHDRARRALQVPAGGDPRGACVGWEEGVVHTISKVSHCHPEPMERGGWGWGSCWVIPVHCMDGCTHPRTSAFHVSDVSLRFSIDGRM